MTSQMLMPCLLSKEKLPEITSRIIETYFEEKSPHHLDYCPLPNHSAVVQITELLKEILYPGYRHRERIHAGNVIYHVGNLLDRLHEILVEQCERAGCHQRGTNASCSPQQKQEIVHWAHEKVLAFLESLPSLRRILSTDVEAALAGDPACRSADEVIFCYPGFEAVTIYRLAHQLHLLDIPLIPRMMTELAHSRTGIDIHPGARIGNYFFIDHGTGVVIGETCVIGNWVKLYQGVTLGALSFARDEQGELVRDPQQQRHPTIEDNVVIYANATILGGKTVVGTGSIIGSSVWVTRSVPPQTTVTIKQQNPNL